ncbi:hypothetical protein [Limnobacter sp.]|uniref:hypothetical protein n=1 Tax=Limnobacter sp. TaxID=2003368 RepID=UPI0025BDF08B|nr:hypothetical protein [Limnobacter sp.]
MSFTNKTQFGTLSGAPVNVQSIKTAGRKTEQAIFEFRKQLGVFAIWCAENGHKVSEQAEKLAERTGLKASTIRPYCSQGKKFVEAKASYKDLERFNAKAKKDGIKAGIENFARHCGGTKLAPAVKADAPKVDEPAKVRTHDTQTVGKDTATRCTIVHPLTMTKTAKENLREAIEAACAASQISLQSLFPELANKVNA